MNSGCSGIRGEPEKPSNISVELVLFVPPLAKSSVKWKKKKKSDVVQLYQIGGE